MIYVFHRKSYGIPPICLTISQRVIIISKLQIRIKFKNLVLLIFRTVFGRSSIRIAHVIPIRWQTWSSQTILVSDWPISNNLLLWNCLAKWAELWFEAPIGGSVCIKFPQSRMKGERHRLSTESLFSVSKARTFVVIQLVTNVALIEYT
jgi:hypothetical protein